MNLESKAQRLSLENWEASRFFIVELLNIVTYSAALNY